MTAISVEVIKAGMRGKRWSEVHIKLPRWRSWRLAYSPVSQRFADGRNLQAARRQPDFADNEFEIVQAIEVALVVASRTAPDAVRNNANRKLDHVRVTAERYLRRRPGKIFSHNALAKALAPAFPMRLTRLRTFYLPQLALTSPLWNVEGKYWEHQPRR